MGLTYYCRNALTDVKNIKEPGGGSPVDGSCSIHFFLKDKVAAWPYR
jgi:hypothetical protein